MKTQSVKMYQTLSDILHIGNILVEFFIFYPVLPDQKSSIPPPSAQFKPLLPATKQPKKATLSHILTPKNIGVGGQKVIFINKFSQDWFLLRFF